jgi:hypothetical protein
MSSKSASLPRRIVTPYHYSLGCDSHPVLAHWQETAFHLTDTDAFPATYLAGVFAESS